MSSTKNLQALEHDKAAHFGLSYGATLTGYVALRSLGKSKLSSLLISAIVVNSIGLIKEATDPKVDAGDVLANTLGSLAVSFPVLIFDF